MLSGAGVAFIYLFPTLPLLAVYIDPKKKRGVNIEWVAAGERRGKLGEWTVIVSMRVPAW
jgi:hypothetical protein